MTSKMTSIDRGDASNLTEGLNYYNIESNSPSDIETLNQKG